MPDDDPEDRLSLAPLDPETALRGLLATPNAGNAADSREQDDEYLGEDEDS